MYMRQGKNMRKLSMVADLAFSIGTEFPILSKMVQIDLKISGEWVVVVHVKLFKDNNDETLTNPVAQTWHYSAAVRRHRPVRAAIGESERNPIGTYPADQRMSVEKFGSIDQSRLEQDVADVCH